ncbi:LADA_0H14642g1_1 [Lachancea dasiensis]|uniref:LADA_0H14642g1_1 n=1 Tax=Lachancea dasiensis TaxID=1072105 RepID=A0A1G4K4J4_9SACH|nr:LADA_0H14642g1_1 [Lachancea dasiensis]
MPLRRLRNAFSKPFDNLGALDRLVQFLRLGSSMMVLLFTLILTLGAFVSPSRLFMGKMNTSSIDIAKGLFQVLESSVEASTANYISNGVGLTTSEILILTEYTAYQTSTSPQYVVSSVYGWCRVDNRTTAKAGPRAENYTTCVNAGPDYVFDYKELMNDVGLGVILDYAYDASGDASQAESSYTDYMSSARKLKEKKITLLYVVASFQAVMIVLTLWFYSVKGRSLNHFRESFLIHTVSVLSLLICICALVSVIALASFNLQVRSRIQNELGSMGVSYHLGGAWFTSLWLLAFFSCISCATWSGLVWCITDGQVADGDSYELGILASATQPLQEQSGEADPRDLPKPPILKEDEASQIHFNDINSLESLDLPDTPLSYAGSGSGERVVPVSAFNL